MTTLIPLVNQILSTLVVLSQIVFVAAIFSFFFSHKKSENSLIAFLGKNAIVLAFVVALGATLSSLFYSEIAGYEPCKLCWLQRIFMYPQAIILGVALYKKDRGVINYSLILSAIGALIAGYHYLLQIGYAPALPCSAIGYSASCSQRFVLQYGYITIPMMALTAFALIILFMTAAKISEKSGMWLTQQ